MVNVKPVRLGKNVRMSFSKINEVLDMPNLIEVQKDSYKWFLEEGLQEVFRDVSAITDYSGNLVLDFIDYHIEDKPKYTIEECKERDVTYAAPLRVQSPLLRFDQGVKNSTFVLLVKHLFPTYMPFKKAMEGKNKMQPIAKSGYFFGLLAIFLWSWNVIISRYLAPFIPPFQISFFRWFIAGICLLPFTYKQVLKEKITLLKSWEIVLFLSVGLAFMNNFIYQAGHSTSAIDMSLLATMGPVLMVIFSWIFFRRSLSKRQIIGFLITFLGVLIVISGGKISAFQDFRFAAGNLWMLVFALLFGLYGAFEQKRPQNLSQISFLSVTITVGTLTLLPFFLTTLDKNPLSNIGIVQWGLLAYLGIVNSIFGYLAWNIALSRIGSLRAGLLYYLLPLFSSIEAFFVLDEHLALGELIGAAFVFWGIVVGSMHKKSAS